MTNKTSQKLNTFDLALIAMFTSVIAICSWISIPTAVPFTLQTFAVFLTVNVLGGKRGTLAILTYLMLGIVGAPVFSGFSGGLGHLLNNTGGFIIGFLFTALVMWGIEYWIGRKKWSCIFSMMLGLSVCYTFGTGWFLFIYTAKSGAIGLGTALTWCVFPYIIPDIIKMMLAYALSRRLAKYGITKSLS